MDHLFNAGYLRQRLGGHTLLPPLSILSYVAAKTDCVILGTSVMVLPYHHPVELTKYAATLDHLSDGRLVLGVGAGRIEEEFEAVGVPFHHRGFLASALARAVAPSGREAWARLKMCSAPDCHWVFYDRSKPRTGRWCSMAVCGNRVKAREYRRRRLG